IATYFVYAVLLLSLIMVFLGPMFLIVSTVGASLIALICILYAFLFLLLICCRYYRFRGTTYAAHEGVTSINIVCVFLLVSSLSWLVALYLDNELRSASISMLVYLIFDLLSVIGLLRINYFGLSAPPARTS